MPALALGSYQNIVYVKYQGGINTPTPSILERYDVTTGSTPTAFATLPNPGEGALLEVAGWTAM